MGSTAVDEQFKILLVGESGVGKSAILLRYTEDTFDDIPPTIGVDFKTKKMEIDDKKVKLTLWDTAGQERFRTLTSAYYRGAHGVIFVYDVTRRDTFQRLKDDWLNELDHYSTNADIVKMVVGNKIDLAPRTVSQGEGDTFSKQVGALFVESSAKTCTGVERAFEDLVRRILRTPSLCSERTAHSDSIPVQAAGDEDSTWCSC